MLALATYKDNQKKNGDWDNISTNLQTTAKLSKYVDIFLEFSCYSMQLKLACNSACDVQ